MTQRIVLRTLTLALIGLGLAGCSVLNPTASRPAAPAATSSGVVSTPLGAARAQAPEALDQTTSAEKAAALAAAPKGGEQVLGKQVVALGPPAEQGLWVATSFVGDRKPGRVTAPNGKSLAVELRPGSGAAHMSLAAYQALGIGLTELPELTIYGG